MQFTNSREAKEFFIRKIVAQAKKENQYISKHEMGLLEFSVMEENAGDESVDDSSDAEFEKKMGSLLKHAYEDDLRVFSLSAESYKEAYHILNKEDHYILVIIDQSIADRLKDSIFKKFFRK